MWDLCSGNVLYICALWPKMWILQTKMDSLHHLSPVALAKIVSFVHLETKKTKKNGCCFGVLLDLNDSN